MKNDSFYVMGRKQKITSSQCGSSNINFTTLLNGGASTGPQDGGAQCITLVLCRIILYLNGQ